MKQITQIFCILALVIGGMALDAKAQENGNLLVNADLTQGNGQQVPGWQFSTWNVADKPSLTGKVDGMVNTDTDGHRYLSISSSDSLHYIQMWWQSTSLTCASGGTYTFSVSAKGTVKNGNAKLSVGIYFMDNAGKWLGFQEITNDQTAGVAASWQKVEGKVVAPENASKIGVRIGLVFADGQAEVFFKDPVLLLKSN